MISTNNSKIIYDPFREEYITEITQDYIVRMIHTYTEIVKNLTTRIRNENNPIDKIKLIIRRKKYNNYLNNFKCWLH